MADNEIIATTLPHSDFGDPECCGCFVAVIREDLASIKCNECGSVIKTVPVSDLQRTLDDMELSLDVASEICPKCGVTNLFPGFSRMVAFICQHCGSAVKVEDSPET